MFRGDSISHVSGLSGPAGPPTVRLPGSFSSPIGGTRDPPPHTVTLWRKGALGVRARCGPALLKSMGAAPAGDASLAFLHMQRKVSASHLYSTMPGWPGKETQVRCQTLKSITWSLSGNRCCFLLQGRTRAGTLDSRLPAAVLPPGRTVLWARQGGQPAPPPPGSAGGGSGFPLCGISVFPDCFLPCRSHDWSAGTGAAAATFVTIFSVPASLQPWKLLCLPARANELRLEVQTGSCRPSTSVMGNLPWWQPGGDQLSGAGTVRLAPAPGPLQLQPLSICCTCFLSHVCRAHALSASCACGGSFGMAVTQDCVSDSSMRVPVRDHRTSWFVRLRPRSRRVPRRPQWGHQGRVGPWASPAAEREQSRVENRPSAGRLEQCPQAWVPAARTWPAAEDPAPIQSQRLRRPRVGRAAGASGVGSWAGQLLHVSGEAAA